MTACLRCIGKNYGKVIAVDASQFFALQTIVLNILMAFTMRCSYLNYGNSAEVLQVQKAIWISSSLG